MSTTTVVASFANRSDADLGMTRLLMVGFQPEQIGFLERAGQIRVSAEVSDAQRGTIAAAVLHDSDAIEVASPVPGRLELSMRHPASSEEAA